MTTHSRPSALDRLLAHIRAPSADRSVLVVTTNIVVTSAESRAICDDPYSKGPVTKGELYEMQRQVYYALRTFREAILEHIG